MSAGKINSYQEIKAEIMRRIVERVWLPGDLIPTDLELSKEFGCARLTVSRALRELADAGLLSRRRKAGTRVALHPVRKAIFDIPIIRVEVEQRGLSYRYRLLEKKRTPPPPLIAGQLDVPDNANLLHVRAIHLAGNRPYLHEDRWLNPKAVPEILKVDLRAHSANEWLVRNAPFTHGDISFSGANATKQEAELLDAKEGAAILIMERITWNGTTPITLARLAYAPGHRMHTKI